MHTSISSENGLIWYSLIQPSPQELAEFVRDTNIHSDDTELLVQEHQHPEVTVRDKYLLIHLQVPTFDRRNRVTRGTSLYFVVGQNKLWTINHETIVNLDRLLGDYQATKEIREEYFSNGALGLALHIISAMHRGAFAKLERLAKHLDIGEDAVFQGNERKMVEEVFILMRDVMDFRKVMRLQNYMFATIPDHPFMTADLSVQWLRLHNQTQRLWDVLEGLYETASELSETNRSLLQHKENELLRLLTLYSVVMIPVIILVDPFFDPGAPNANTADFIAFMIVLLLLLSTLGFIFFRSKKKRLL